MKLIDLNFFVNNEFSSLTEAVEGHKEALGYIDYIQDKVEIEVIKHIGCDDSASINNVKYSSFKAKNGFLNIPFRTLLYVKRQKPDVVIVQGLIFPVQTIFLRFILGGKCIIIAQHHKETPFKKKRIFQKIADRCINGYLFTTVENAKYWLSHGIIRNSDKCYELLEASTPFMRMNKAECRSRLGLNANNIFLHVGRLNDVKDPLTVLSGFEKYLDKNADSRLYMIYQTEELLPEVKAKIAASELLVSSVHLVGKVRHNELEDWYSAADFYISGSHNESTGYALLESMACGCIPIVTDIPPFRKLTDDGKYGLLYTPGDPERLFKALAGLKNAGREEMSGAIIAHFNKELSFKAIADGLLSIIKKLLPK